MVPPVRVQKAERKKELHPNILWVDSAAALAAGVVVLSLIPFFHKIHHLPKPLLAFIGGVNLLYGTCSLTLAIKKERTPTLILLLVLANAAWAINCVRLTFMYSQVMSLFGALHLIGEAVFVGLLAYLEWRRRDRLVSITSN